MSRDFRLMTFSLPFTGYMSMLTERGICMEFYIETGVCVGCGLCEEIAPTFFKIGNYHAELLCQPVKQEEIRLLEDLARDCPAGAIRRRE